MFCPWSSNRDRPFSSASCGPKDEAFLLSFDVGVNLEQDYTSDVRQLERAMAKVQINTAAGGGSVGVPGIGQGPIPTHGDPQGNAALRRGLSGLRSTSCGLRRVAKRSSC